MFKQQLTVNDDVYFIRHKEFNGDRENILEIMKQKRIAIRFDNKPWNDVFDTNTGQPLTVYFQQFNKNDKPYRNAYHSSLNYFNILSSVGGYIVAEYLDGEMPGGGCGAIVSRVLKGTQVESAAGFEVTLQLDVNFCEIIDYSKYPVLLAIRPPFVTICKPSRNTYKEFVNFKLGGNTLPNLSLDLLHPKMAEQMCVEYLRSVGVNGHNLSYCTLRPGNTLAVIDICGVSDNDKNIFAQVKNGNIENDALDAFVKFTQNNFDGVNIVFSKDRNKARPNVVFVNIDDVFDHFKESNQKMLVKMIF